MNWRTAVRELLAWRERQELLRRQREQEQRRRAVRMAVFNGVIHG
jgi:hypothetical protein